MQSRVFLKMGTTKNLYEEGEQILGPGFDGTVTISYLGGTGNDVTLNLVALLGDYNRDGRVDGADYVVWRKTGINGEQGYADWRANFGTTAPGFVAGLGARQVPEPAAWILIVTGMMACGARHRNRHGANIKE